jgi:hypothetical protein
VKKLLVVTAALVAAVAVFVGVTLPPRRLQLTPPTDGTIPGVVHVHTNRSDGLSSPDVIAAAAARAGLKFVVFTDHGDGTRAPDAPVYRSGVLCVDGVEISTSGGHYIAIDMPAAPYPLRGEARDVVEDVRRLGGFGIAAHPDSPKLQLKWREWTAPIDAIELLNPDTSWRLWAQQASGTAEKWIARRRLLTAVVDYPFRPAEVVSSLTRPTTAWFNWEALARRRKIVAIAGVDAHARIALAGGDPGDAPAGAGSGGSDLAEGRFALPLPGYEPSFRVLSVHVRPDAPLSGDAAADARVLMRAIRAGHLYTAVDGAATPASFEFTAANRGGTAQAGDELAADGPVTLRVRSNAPSGFTTTVWNGTRVLASDRHEQDFTIQAPAEPGVYWVEIRATGTPSDLTWIRSNAIYVRSTEPAGALPARPAAREHVAMFDGLSAAGWRVEHDSTSLAAVETAGSVSGNELRFRYGLAGGAAPHRVAALAYDTPAGTAPHDRIGLTIRAEKPMRISVQLRAGEDQGEASHERWQRTIYVDTAAEERTVFFDELMPVGETHTFRPAFNSIRTILLVVDATNTKPGDSGRIWIKRAELQR